ncbi:hypothetical protein OD91_1627 [Lutibacter sp. Hel_I_33_5]|uniref:hypothetical protein n=1 Tax=Lutibacter sp. Hel_I_33_5 TaxID=1566289 RepID=UPI00119E66C3|nr:hypothetical protein [Lutibacter sp. Hel_I_33_5]TVZ56342.1 hypothetical protein OD91_1627 [Lutibacter sp. Hel_I_33_5]
MNPDFVKRQVSFLIQLIIVAGLLLAVHSYLLHHFASKTAFFFPLWQIYVFHIVITYLLYSLINNKYSHGKTEIFNVFMIGTLLKMVFVILFLLPLLLSEVKNKQPDVFNFFIPYFLLLAFEVFSITKFLQKKD